MMMVVGVTNVSRKKRRARAYSLASLLLSSDLAVIVERFSAGNVELGKLVVIAPRLDGGLQVMGAPGMSKYELRGMVEAAADLLCEGEIGE